MAVCGLCADLWVGERGAGRPRWCEESGQEEEERGEQAAIPDEGGADVSPRLDTANLRDAVN